MKAMILSAGRGKRLRPITDHTPKPLIEVKGEPLIVHQIKALKAAGIQDIVINIAHLKEKFYETLGSGEKYGVHITYSHEPEGGLETGGGIQHALPLFNDKPFIVTSGDLYTDFPFQSLPKTLDGQAHIILTDNPSHHPAGDFTLNNNTVALQGPNPLNYAGIGLYHPDLFKEQQPGFYPLGPILEKAIENQQVTGFHYKGNWMNVGTVEQLEQI